MSTVTANDQFRCEQCGTPLVVSGTARRCLHCLLQSGIQPSSFSQASNQERYTYEHYEILRREDGSLWELGRNSVSVTYKARDTNLDMLVALKVLNPDLSSQPEARADFLRQAQAMAQIRHPNVVNIIQFGRTVEGRKRMVHTEDPAEFYFCALEFLDGDSLQRWVSSNGPLTTILALEIARQVAQVLHFAETCQVTIAGLTLSNILLLHDQSRLIGPPTFSLMSAKLLDIDADFRAARQRVGLAPKYHHENKHFLGELIWYSITGEVGKTTFLRRQLLSRKLPLPVRLLLKLLLRPDLTAPSGSWARLLREIEH